MKNWTDYDTFLMHLECTIENVGVNAIKHQDQEKVHEEAKKAVEFIVATIERQKGREEKTIKTGKQHEPTNEAETKSCNIYGVSNNEVAVCGLEGGHPTCRFRQKGKCTCDMYCRYKQNDC